MYSGGQTQDPQITISQSPPHVWCAPLLAADIGGPADSVDGIVDGFDCRTPPALGTVKPLVCSNTLNEEKLSQCTDRLTDVYMINWRRSPENLRSVFEGFVELFVNSLFKTCSTPQSTPQSAGQCMLGALADGNILIKLWGGDFTLSDFIIKLGDMLSGQPLPVCTFTEIQAGMAGLTCRAPADGWSTPNPGQGGSNPWAAPVAGSKS